VYGYGFFIALSSFTYFYTFMNIIFESSLFLILIHFLTQQTTERASRKREAGAPTQGGIPSKLAVSRAAGNVGLPRK